MTRQRIIDDEDKRLELFLHGGDDLGQLYRQYTDPNGEPDNYQIVIRKINDHLNPQSNVHLNKCQFRQIKQHYGESLNELVQRVRESAKQCKFQPEMHEEECVSQLIHECESKSLRMKALNSKKKLSMRDIVDMGRLDENVNACFSVVPSIDTASVKAVGQKMPCRNSGFNMQVSDWDMTSEGKGMCQVRQAQSLCQSLSDPKSERRRPLEVKWWWRQSW